MSQPVNIVMAEDLAVKLYADLSGKQRMSPVDMADAAQSVAQALARPVKPEGFSK